MRRENAFWKVQVSCLPWFETKNEIWCIDAPKYAFKHRSLPESEKYIRMIQNEYEKSRFFYISITRCNDQTLSCLRLYGDLQFQEGRDENMDGPHSELKSIVMPESSVFLMIIFISLLNVLWRNVLKYLWSLCAFIILKWKIIKIDFATRNLQHQSMNVWSRTFKVQFELFLRNTCT